MNWVADGHGAREHELAAGGGGPLLDRARSRRPTAPSAGSGSCTSTESARASPSAVQSVPAGMNSATPGRSSCVVARDPRAARARQDVQHFVGVVVTPWSPARSSEPLREHPDLEQAPVRSVVGLERVPHRASLTR